MAINGLCSTNVCSILVYSMILLQYLHRLGKECDISAAISISASFDPFMTRKSIEGETINKYLYSRAIIGGIKNIVRR